MVQGRLMYGTVEDNVGVIRQTTTVVADDVIRFAEPKWVPKNIHMIKQYCYNGFTIFNLSITIGHDSSVRDLHNLSEQNRIG